MPYGQSDNNNSSANLSTSIFETKDFTLPSAAYGDEYWRKNPIKPPFSYRTLVAKALYSAGSRGRTLKEIYDWIEENFSFFRKVTSGSGASWRSRCAFVLTRALSPKARHFL
jgi:hypothetical protein